MQGSSQSAPYSAPMPSHNNHIGQTEPSSGTVAPLTSLLHVSKTVLLQAVDLLDNYLTSDDQLTISSKFLCGSTIGMPRQTEKTWNT